MVGHLSHFVRRKISIKNGKVMSKNMYVISCKLGAVMILNELCCLVDDVPCHLLFSSFNKHPISTSLYILASSNV